VLCYRYDVGLSCTVSKASHGWKSTVSESQRRRFVITTAPSSRKHNVTSVAAIHNLED
jgi:hypothetical protein